MGKRGRKPQQATCHPERPNYAHGRCRLCYRRVSRWRHLLGLDLTEAQYDTLLAQQGGVCALCGAPPQPHRRLAVDHCHDNGHVRGLLCRRCNTTLRQWITPEWLLRAATYLTQPPPIDVAAYRKRAPAPPPTTWDGVNALHAFPLSPEKIRVINGVQFLRITKLLFDKDL